MKIKILSSLFATSLCVVLLVLNQFKPEILLQFHKQIFIILIICFFILLILCMPFLIRKPQFHTMNQVNAQYNKKMMELSTYSTFNYAMVTITFSIVMFFSYQYIHQYQDIYDVYHDQGMYQLNLDGKLIFELNATEYLHYRKSLFSFFCSALLFGFSIIFLSFRSASREIKY